MRKLISFLLLCWLLSFGVVSFAIADDFSGDKSLFDNAQLLTPEQKTSIQNGLHELKTKYDMDFVIVTTVGTDPFSDTQFADDFYDYNDFGEDGMLLLINTDPNGWHISTSGLCIRYFTDYGIEKIGSLITPYLSAGDFYAAFEQFVILVDSFIEQGESKPYDTNNNYQTESEKSDKTTSIVISMLFLALAIALIVVRVMVVMMNTVRRQASAKEYESGFKLTNQSDIYLYSRTTSERINSSSGGGSSTHSGSSGRSHGGGGGKF